MFLEGKAVQSIEDDPLSKKDVEQLKGDRKQGIWHYNKEINIEASGR